MRATAALTLKGAPDGVAAALEGVRRREPAAMRRLYVLTSAKLLSICLRILRDRGEAEEALQDVFLTVWRRPEVFDPMRGGGMAWLITVSRNRAIDRLRSRRQPASADESAAAGVAEPGLDPAARLLADENARRLDACLERLEPQTAQAIRRAFENGLTYEELAAAAGVPLATMKSRIRRGLLKLREEYEP